MNRIEHVIISGQECKLCSKCKEAKPLEQFNRSSRSWDGLSWNCKPCTREKTRNQWHGSAKTRVRKTASTVKRSRDNKVSFIEYKGGRCERCSLVHAPFVNSGVFQFHHRDESQKSFAISSRLGSKLEVIKSELDKCELLCANCHALHHYQEWMANGKSRMV